MADMRESQFAGRSILMVEKPPPGIVCTLLREESPVMRKAVVPFCMVGTVVMVSLFVSYHTGVGVSSPLSVLMMYLRYCWNECSPPSLRPPAFA